MSSPRKSSTLLALAALLLSASAARAVRPQSWKFSLEKDYAQGKFDNTVVNSYGQLTLGRSLTPIETNHTSEIISSFAQTSDGSVYVATSAPAKVYKIDGDKSSVAYSAPKGFTDITAMIADDKGNLFVALSGDSARLVRVSTKTKNAPVIRFEDKDVDYIWSLAISPDGTLYLGTGPHGKVYKLPEHGDPETLLDSTGKNITSLALSKSGDIYVGTDAPGLVIKVDGKSSKPFVLLDAGQVDINALLIGTDSNLYVATAKADLTPENPNATAPGDDNDTKSKPDASEPEPTDPPADDAANKKIAPQGKGDAAIGLPGIFAAPQDIPPEMKDLLKKAIAAKQQAAKTSDAKKDPLLAKQRKAPEKMPSPPEDETDNPNSLFRITPDGAVTSLMQQEDLNYSLLQVGSDLLIGTGDEGKLYRYNLDDQSTALIARTKEQHITALFSGADGAVYLGTSNMANVYRLGASLAKTGTFLSQTLDASHSANWGHVIAETTLPDGTQATVSARTGNTHDADANAKFWSDWSDESDLSKPTLTSSPVARYLQIRVTLTGDGKDSTPTLNSLRLAYQTQNLPPRLKSVTIDSPDAADDDTDAPAPSDSADPTPKPLHISWEATDPNADTLVYRLYAKRADDPADIWTPLAKNLADTSFDWDTHTLADGKYLVKVIASDSPDNPLPSAFEVARTSSPVTIDHTPPALSDLTPTVDGNKVTLSGDAKDALSTISDVRYQIDGQGDWQPAAPSDKIFDSPQEAFTIVTRPLSAGGHRITVRATDAHGNSSYKAATVTVKP